MKRCRFGSHLSSSRVACSSSPHVESDGLAPKEPFRSGLFSPSSAPIVTCCISCDSRTHLSCHAHAADECTSYRSDTRVEDALRKSRASPPPHLRSPRTSSPRASCKVPTSSSHDDRSCSSLSAHSASSPGPFRPPCLSSSLLPELLLLLAHPPPSTLHYHVDCLVD